MYKTLKIVIFFFLFHVSLSAELMKYQDIHKHQNTAIYGTLNIKGSPSTAKLLDKWTSKFQEYYPEIKIRMELEHATQGLQALRKAEANIAISNRKISKKEKDLFKKKRGYYPTEIKVSLNVLAIYVNRENKMQSISLSELDAIFSTSLKREHTKIIKNWQDLGNSHQKIHIYLYDSNASERSYFRHKVMKNGTFNRENIISDAYQKSSDIINAIGSDVQGIGFASVENKNYKVKALALSKKAYFPSYKPNNKNIRNGKYPLTKFFYMYLDIPEDKPIPKILYEFCKYIFSKDGQEIVSNIGGLALSSKQVGIELTKIRR
ncbi:Phosphate ABC transporter, periplasmic phosphate-binding protein PstS (TC 3.A.1.7.1) [hydrothermal vent metagenome]|uniref:Phosphate ABC transporter, periplasmic phosphate-binding protein PstS (TC 3.A.1.7.1) n=1 Tax=hydrothermal vent metagenome TaxID=652676 RepID=A0A1W1CDN2_9ZZZZ